MIMARINSVDPPNGIIILLEKEFLKINYDSLSNRNITIYLFNGTDYVICQTTSGQFCSIESDNKTVFLNVLSSTFNIQNGEYHISISSNFIKSNNSNDPMVGLYNKWILYTDIY